MTNEEYHPDTAAMSQAGDPIKSKHDEDTDEHLIEDGAEVKGSMGESFGSSVWKTTLGLLVVWGALLGVFTANSVSDARIESMRAGRGDAAKVTAPDYPMITHSQLMEPYMVRFPTASTPEALKMLGTYCNLEISEDNLAILGPAQNETREFRFEAIPLYRLLHGLINNSKIGFVIAQNQLRLIPQTLETSRQQDRVWRIQWSADLELDRQKVIVSPTGDVDLWLMLMLEPAPASKPNSKPELIVELWQGGQWLAMGRTPLMEGQAQLSLETTERARVGIEQKRPSTPTQPALFSISLSWTNTHLVDREPK